MSNLTDTDLDRIAEMISKMKNLADRAGTPDEAAAATTKIQEFLFRYNLSMADVSRRTSGFPQTPAFTKTTINLGSTTVWLTQWKRTLVNGICKVYFCRALSQSLTSDVMYLVGAEYNLRVVVEMYDYLSKAISRLCLQMSRGEQFRSDWEGRKWRESFYLGATSRIIERLKEQRWKDEAANNSSTAIVIDLESQVTDAFREMFPSTHRQAPSKIRNPRAFEAGTSAAQDISLAKQVRG